MLYLSHRSLVLSLAALTLSTAALAAPPKKDEAPIPENLPARHREWLEEVALLISPKEREAFLAVKQDYQRDAFIRRFWAVRDPFPKTARNELQEQWQERVKLAKERFGNITEDRARILLLNGEPAEVFPVRCDLLLPMEIWSWPGTERIKGDFSLAFVSQGGFKGPFRLWYPTEGVSSILALSLRARPPQEGSMIAQQISDGCPRGDDIAARLAETLDWHAVESKVQLVPKPGEEWLSTFSSASTDVPEGAATFPAEMDLSFPGRYGSRTVVQGLVSVPRGEVKAERLEGSPVSAYSFLVDGEILYRGELFDHFRYRFSLPESEAARSDKIPLVFQRYLRPGAYTLVLKVEDVTGGRYFREQRELQVPSAPAVETEAAPPLDPATPSAPPPPAAPPRADLAEANAADAIGSDDRTIRILPPPPGLTTGKARIQALTTGEGIAKVSFELNGRLMLSKTKPPYSVELVLGDQPRTHTVRAIALGPSGEKLAEDEMLLNAGPHRFTVRLVEPQPGKTYQSSLRAQAEVEVPEGETVDRVELYLNETLVATLYQPPYTQPILLPGPEPGYVRAVVYLADGNFTEDTVLINTPGAGERIDGDFVELYTTVVDQKGRPVEGLSQKDFKVFEDGVEQQVRRFELVRDVPIHAGLLIDTSWSMAEGNGEKLDAAVRGALSFFETVITPKDRAAVITFSDGPTLAVRFTNNQEVLAGGLAGLTAEGGTALYDSLIYALHYFGGIRGKKAIVVLSDGKDEGSRYQFDDTLEYARRSGVSLYAVGIGLSPKDMDVRLKLSRLSEETGGRVFFIDRAAELDRVYDSIEEELRSQYLLAYQSSNASRDDKFRAVEVKVARPGLEAKTLRGYYP
ncbi:MAG TPA: VWA domain-containing protein [Thermoanaerobaculia bacterium]|nr:VWA domain-containing protein [Thermoanaerobaculia bacterium]